MGRWRADDRLCPCGLQRSAESSRSSSAACEQRDGIDTEKLRYLARDESLAEAKRLFAADPGTYKLLDESPEFPTQYKVVPRSGQLQN